MPCTPTQSPTRKTLATLALLTLAVLSACAPHKPTQSGFLTSASTMSAPAARYTSVMIDPVEFLPAGRTPKTIKPEDIAALTAAYHAALTAEFASRFTVTTEPGPDTLRIRAAITGYTMGNPAWNAVSLALPIGPKNGGISTEAEVLDARTGAQVASQTQAFNGHLWNSAPTAIFDRDGHAQSGFRKAAKDLAAQID